MNENSHKINQKQMLQTMDKQALACHSDKVKAKRNKNSSKKLLGFYGLNLDKQSIMPNPFSRSKPFRGIRKLYVQHKRNKLKIDKKMKHQKRRIGNYLRKLVHHR